MTGTGLSVPEAKSILPRSKWWWAGLALLLVLAGWLYLRGYNTSLPFIEHHDEAQNLLEAQHIIDFGHARGVFRESYPPGLRTVIYPLLKHVKPVEAHQGTMLPPLRLITISAWMLVVVVIALLGYQMAHPLTGLMAAAIWIVNPWVVDRAHFVLPDGYLTLFTMLALWLALVGSRAQRGSYTAASVYSIMLAIAFKTQALFVAPFIVLLPLLDWWRAPERRTEALKLTFWNCLRFAVFLFWLLLIYPTLDAPRDIYLFPVTELRLVIPTAPQLWQGLSQLLLTFQPLEIWLLTAIAGCLLVRYRRRVDFVALVLVGLSAAAWLVGTHLLPTRGFHLRQYFGMGAMLALLFGAGLSGFLFFLEEQLSRRSPPPALAQLLPRARPALPVIIVALLVAIAALPNYFASDALAYNFSLHDRRNDLMRYMDISLPPAKYISDRDGPYHKVFNRSWGGYTGAHDYPLASTMRNLPAKSLETWRGDDTEYAIMPYVDDSDAYFPDQTIRLKSYPPDPNFRDPGMVVLRLYPMQFEAAGQLGPIHLVGYDLNTTRVTPGEDLIFRHYWRADAPTAATKHVFNHLLDNDGEIVAQADYVPLWDDRRPTTTWDDPDEIMLGREFVMRLPDDLPAGGYRLISGLYDPVNWQRLTASDGADHLFITDIEVSPAQ